MAEFTGERVIPELVDADLLNEHLARYRFAKHFIHGVGLINGVERPLNILDAGCGSGYGTMELSGPGVSVTGTDISTEAVEHARQRYAGTGASFQVAPCEALPFDKAAFDLVTAFEVIEHLEHWQELLAEANRVLKATGVLLVSTPNRDYYAESRGASGPNPFHLHEFDYEEFRQALGAVFPHVTIWTQNHVGAIVFAPQESKGKVLEAAPSDNPSSAHFYLAACSQSPIAVQEIFAWIPSTANLLREREQHIAKLAGELEQKDAWLRQALEAHSELQRNHEAVIAELERQNTWASDLNREIAARNSRIGDLQKEVESRLTWIAALESQLRVSAVEIERLNAEAQDETQTARGEIERLNAEALDVRQKAQAEFDRLAGEIGGLHAALAERTAWAEKLNGEITEYRGQLQRIGASPWFRTGATLGLGPRLPNDQLPANQSRDGQ